MPQARYSAEEHAQRGNTLYERQVRSQVENGNHGRIVVIDIETGAYEVGDDVLAASKALLSRYPDAQIWAVRIGHRGVYRIGGHAGKKAKDDRKGQLRTGGQNYH